MSILDLNCATTTLRRRINVTKEFILWAIEYEREDRKKKEAPLRKDRPYASSVGLGLQVDTSRARHSNRDYSRGPGFTVDAEAVGRLVNPYAIRAFLRETFNEFELHCWGLIRAQVLRPAEKSHPGANPASRRDRYRRVPHQSPSLLRRNAVQHHQSKDRKITQSR